MARSKLMTSGFAVRHGHVDIVRELLNNGVDLDAPIGAKLTTPLQLAVWCKQLDVVRFLLGRGASQDHVNTWGWNASFFCRPALQHGQPDMLDFFQLLSADAYRDLDILDIEGWSVLHRVAGFGLPSAVVRLINHGADPQQGSAELKMNALMFAARHGNLATFRALLPYYEAVTTMTDQRGWTLLHFAAQGGDEDIIEFLLRSGADVDALSQPFRSEVPDSLHDCACRPIEVASATGNGHVFERALERWHLSRTRRDDEDAYEEIFFDAVSGYTSV